MTTRTYRRLNKKWECGIGDHYGVQQMINELRNQGIVIPRGLTRIEKIPGLFMYERLERLFHDRKAWKNVRGVRVLRSKLECFLNVSRRAGHNMLSALPS